MAADAVRSGVRGILGGVRAPARLEAKCSGKRNSPASSILLSTKHWRYRPRRLRERIERCPQVRKSAPVRVHGQESVRDSTTGTLASQGLHTQVPRYTVFT